MNVAVIRNSEFESTTSFYRAIDAIKASGYQPVVFSRNRKNNNVIFEQKIIGDITVNQININSIRGGGLKNIINLIMYQLSLFFELVKNNRKVGIIHSFDFDATLPSFIFAKLYRKKIIYHIADFYVDSRAFPKVLKKIIKKIDFFLINKVDQVIICTEERADQILGSKPKKISVVHNVPVINFEIKKSNELDKDYDLVLTYVGALNEKRFIKEVLLTIGKLENVKLYIGGKGELSDYVENFSRKYKNIEFLGELSYKDAMKYNDRADVLFAIYDPNVANHKYSAPNKVYEAMYLGKPIIVANNTGMNKIVGDNKIGLIIDYTIMSFVHAIKELLFDENKIPELSINLQCISQEYSKEKMIKKLSAIYKELGC